MPRAAATTVIDDPVDVTEQVIAEQLPGPIDEPDVAQPGELAVVADAAVALADQWEGSHMEFKGDKLQIRVPTAQGLAGFSLSQTKFIPTDVRNNLIGLFIYQHLSLESYVRVFGRLMDPSDDEYGVETISDLMTGIVEEYKSTPDPA
jgi:hypothetical protein